MSHISGYEAVYRLPKNPKNANLQNEPNPIFEHSGPPIPSGLPRNLKSAKPEAFQTMEGSPGLRLRQPYPMPRLRQVFPQTPVHASVPPRYDRRRLPGSFRHPMEHLVDQRPIP